MWLTNSISSAHRLHLSVWFPHGSVQRLSCCVITCLEVTSGISPGTQLLDPSPDKSQKHLSVRKERIWPAPIPSAHPSLLMVSWSAFYLLDTPLSSHAWGPAEKCQCNCQGTFALPVGTLQRKPFLDTSFKLYIVLSRAQRATLVPEEPWCPCVGEPWAIPWLRDRNYL